MLIRQGWSITTVFRAFIPRKSMFIAMYVPCFPSLYNTMYISAIQVENNYIPTVK